MKEQPIIRQKVGDQAFQQLKTMIEQGTWPQGERIPPERELCEQLHVSHTTVRQAIQRLNALGFLKTRPGSGSYVMWQNPQNAIQTLIPASPMDSKSLKDVLEFREMLECYAARLAAERASEETIINLAERCRQVTTITAPEESAAADAAFHYAVGIASGNDMIIRSYALLNTVLASSILEEIRQRGVTRQQHHRDLVDAIARHDSAAAEAIMRFHLLDLRRFYVNYPIRSE